MISNFERSWAILEYLRRNSDSKHPVSRAIMKEDPAMKRYVDGKVAFNNAVFHMALAMNCGENGTVLPSEEQWRIVYRAFSEKYGNGNGADDEADGAEETSGGDRAQTSHPEPLLPAYVFL